MKRNTSAMNTMEIQTAETGTMPDWVKLLPAGKVMGRDGRNWQNSRPDDIVAHFAGLARDLPIDIEHATEIKAPKGEPAPAIGWVTRIENRNGEIWGQTEWNDAGARTVGGREYRYLSPVILYKEADKTIAGITSVGATNQPNLMLPALNNETRGTAPQEETMWKNVLAALSLPETATEEEAVEAIKALKGDQAEALNRANNPSLDSFVPRADYDAALAKASNAVTKLAELTSTQRESAITSAIEKALSEGKITPATADYHRAQCRQDGGLDRFAAYCSAAPVIGGASGLDGKTPSAETKALNAQETEILASLGIDADEYSRIV